MYRQTSDREDGKGGAPFNGSKQAIPGIFKAREGGEAESEGRDG